MIRTFCRLYDRCFVLLFYPFCYHMLIHRLTLTTDRKVQTIKDLEKPWAALAPRRLRSASPPYSPSVVASNFRLSSPEWTGHSAATTILLDDSHAKAALQPNNHLCVLEYTRAQRNSDLAVLQHEQAEQRSALRQEDSAAAAVDADADALIASSPDGTAEKVRKRKRKKKQAQESTVPATTTADGAPAAFDETLLAVIGILHAARLESSVAGWLRAGALFLPLSERGGGDSGGDAKAWCDDPALVSAWAGRGREAMHELHLKVEHGIES